MDIVGHLVLEVLRSCHFTPALRIGNEEELDVTQSRNNAGCRGIPTDEVLVGQERVLHTANIRDVLVLSKLPVDIQAGKDLKLTILVNHTLYFLLKPGSGLFLPPIDQAALPVVVLSFVVEPMSVLSVCVRH